MNLTEENYKISWLPYWLMSVKSSVNGVYTIINI